MSRNERLLEACELCGSGEFTNIYKRNEYHSHIVQCNNCGVTFSNPQVEIDYKSHGKYIRKHLKNEVGRRKTAQWRIEQIKKHYNNGRLFEIGCSAGLFLDEARKAGFDVSGSELNKDAVDYARKELGLIVHDKIDLSEINNEKKWDVIVMFNLLEHIPKPMEFLSYVTENMLSENGIMVIEVPHIFTIHSKITGTKGQHLSMAHFFYYSAKTMENLIDRIGFNILDKQWGKRVYTIGISFEIVLRRHKWLKALFSKLLNLAGLYEKHVAIGGTHDFLFYIVSRKDKK
ncbi:MAG: class I SAM-dependent methyltransferase [Cellulophaga sp.]